MNQKLHVLQNSINQIYVEKFKDYQGGLNLSVPCIPRISEAYFENRVVVVGQETNTWYNETDDDLYKVFLKKTNDIENICLNSKYDVFVEECVQNYPGKFWNFNRRLYDEIFHRPMVEGKYLSHVWLNLFSVEAIAYKKSKIGSPTKNNALAQEIIKMQRDLLYEVLNLLKPKLILFLTGHGLDTYVVNNSLCTKNYEFVPLDKNGLLTERNLAEIKIKDQDHPLSQIKIFRSYHPSYFMGHIGKFKSLQTRINQKIGNKSNSAYYTETFINAIKDYYENRDK
ncbi:MAG: hypothetical protein RBS89_03080 [Candidatus Delongbacteria bacterium]|jgi:hypothetical protein|nr:hypothetical protein [Candidatus Delongbacteria bacterium]